MISCFGCEIIYAQILHANEFSWHLVEEMELYVDAMEGIFSDLIGEWYAVQ